MALTRLQIITEGLSQIGRSDLTSNGRLWLNLFLGKVYRNYDWAWLLKDSGLLAVTDGGATPSDYRAMKAANLYDTSGNYIRPITTMEADEHMFINRAGTGTGTPEKVFVNKQANTFHWWPTPPSSTYKWRGMYYYLPTLPTHTSSAGDGDTPVWGENEDFLIRAIELKGQFFNDDVRYKDAEQILMNELVQARLNSFDNRAGSHKIKYGKSFRKRF